MANKLRYFAIWTGYVESASNSVMLISHQEGFDTVEEAKENLRNLIVLYLNQENQFNGCCKKSFEDKEVNYCSKCGKHRKVVEATGYKVSEAFRQLHAGDVDSSYDILETLFEHRDSQWHFWNSPNESNEWTEIQDFDGWLENYEQ